MSVCSMISMSIWCSTCGSFIYKWTKFNFRQEDVIGEKYLGIQIFRFYFKCTRCSAELTIKTDPQNSDYVVESGATVVLNLGVQRRLRKREMGTTLWKPWRKEPWIPRGRWIPLEHLMTLCQQVWICNCLCRWYAWGLAETEHEHGSCCRRRKGRELGRWSTC